MMESIAEQMQAGLTNKEAIMSAFETNANSDKKKSLTDIEHARVAVQ